MTTAMEIQPLIDKVQALGYTAIRIHRWELCSYGDSLNVPASEFCATKAKYFVEGFVCCVKHTQYVCERILSHERYRSQKCSFCGIASELMYIFWKTNPATGNRELLAVGCSAETRELATLFRELEEHLDPHGKTYIRERL